MKVTTVTTIHLDPDEEIRYTFDGVDFRISAITRGGLVDTLVRLQRVDDNFWAWVAQSLLPFPVAEQVADIVLDAQAWSGVTS